MRVRLPGNETEPGAQGPGCTARCLRPTILRAVMFLCVVIYQLFRLKGGIGSLPLWTMAALALPVELAEDRKISVRGLPQQVLKRAGVRNHVPTTISGRAVASPVLRGTRTEMTT